MCDSMTSMMAYDPRRFDLDLLGTEGVEESLFKRSPKCNGQWNRRDSHKLLGT